MPIPVGLVAFVAFVAFVALAGCSREQQDPHAAIDEPPTDPRAAVGSNGPGPERIVVDGVELHYIASGSGDPVVLIHGSLADYRYWENAGQFAPLAEHYRVIAYSRRYNHPNRNLPADGHSAIVEADDLARLLDRLDLGRTHIVGHSYGAYTALLFALEHPQRVRSLVLAEAPVMAWLDDIPGGEGINESFMRRVWEPMGETFRRDGDEAGLEFTAQWYFQLPFAEVENEWRILFRDNVREWRALSVSADAFPMVDHDRVRSLPVPTLLLSGGKNAGGFNDLIDGQLQRLIPDVERVIIADASHEMFLDSPETAVRTLLEFFARH